MLMEVDCERPDIGFRKEWLPLHQRRIRVEPTIVMRLHGGAEIIDPHRGEAGLEGRRLEPLHIDAMPALA